MNTIEISMIKRHLKNGYSAIQISERLKIDKSEIVEFIRKQDERQQRKLKAKERLNRPKVVKKDINAHCNRGDLLMESRFLITSYAEIAKVINYLNTNHSKAIFEKKPLVVSINSKDEDRTKAQNRLYWMWLTKWANHQGTDKDYEHLFFKKTLLSRIYFRDEVGEYKKTYEAVKQLKKQSHPLYQQLADSITLLTTTTDASTAQFTEYLNDIHAFCNKNGCYLETPDDLKYIFNDGR